MRTGCCEKNMPDPGVPGYDRLDVLAGWSVPPQNSRREYLLDILKFAVIGVWFVKWNRAGQKELV